MKNCGWDFPLISRGIPLISRNFPLRKKCIFFTPTLPNSLSTNYKCVGTSGLHSSGIQSPLLPLRYRITEIRSASGHISPNSRLRNTSASGWVSSTWGTRLGQLDAMLDARVFLIEGTLKALCIRDTLGKACFVLGSLKWGIMRTTYPANCGV